MHFYRGSLCFFALSSLHSTHWNWKLTSVRPMPRRAALAMMNVVAIGLVLSTLAAAGVWSPAPTPPPSTAGEHVVREGRRVVIVEYEREHPLYPGDAVKETHVLPPDSLDGGEGRLTDKARGAVSDAADRVADAAEGGKEKMSDAKESATGKVFGAVKRCKDRLCGAAREAEEGAKDKASAGEHGAEEAARGAEEALSHAKEIAEDKVFDAASKVKETAVGAKDKVSEAAGKAKERASHVQHGAAETVRNAKDKVSHAARHARESARERAMDAKDRVSDVAERAEQCTEDAAGRAAQKAARAEEAVKAKAGEAASNLSDIARRARDVASDAAAHLLGGGPREAARTATAVMHLLGFAAAYGASLWVTFVSSYVLAAALPRQQLAMVQSKLFPMYFRAVAYGVGLALAAHLLGRERSSLAARAQSVNLLAALALVLANMLLLEPKATKVRKLTSLHRSPNSFHSFMIDSLRSCTGDVREDEGGEGGRQGEGHGRHRRPANGHRRGGQHGHHHHRSHGGGAQAGRQQQYGGEVGGGGGAGGRADVQEPGGDAEPAAQEAERLLVSVQRAVPDGADVAPRAPGTSPPDSQRLLGSKLFVVRVVCCESDML